jgi:hypothetical protein
MVKYAEDQHKRKENRSQIGFLGRPMDMNSMDHVSMGMIERMRPDDRDPYYHSRSRMPQIMYRDHSSPMPIGQNLIGESQYHPQSLYPSTRGHNKNMISNSSSMPSTSPSDWYGQIPQMAYDSQMSSQQMHGQGYSQIQPRTGQSQQGNVFVRSPRAVKDPGYNGVVTLIVNCLPQQVDVALLHDLCAPYGKIIDAHIDVESNRINDECARGESVGRVQMAVLSHAQYAVQALNGAIIFDGGRPLQVHFNTSPGLKAITLFYP